MTYYYCTSEDLRMRLHLNADRADDEECLYWINEAQREMLHDVSLEVIDESAQGDIDGSNTTFSVAGYPLADTDFDKSIDVSDISVYGWTDSDDPATKTGLTVSTVYSGYGTIVLSSAPAATYDKITVDYRYYTNSINLSLATNAARELAAYKLVLAKFALIPEKLAHGPVRYTWGRPAAKIYREYLRLLTLMLHKSVVIQEREVAVLERSQY